jgi:urease accessory protein
MGYFEANLRKLRGRYITACMENKTEIATFGWAAQLRLRFTHESGRTISRERSHSGPLRLLKVLYPEGDEIAHAIIVHPPAGIVAGDSLVIDCHVEAGAHAVMSTPGAQKWYRASAPHAGQPARAQTTLHVAPDAVLEWLPTESMIYDGAQGEQAIDIGVETGGKLIAWEMQQWGRTLRGEAFTSGAFSQAIKVHHAGALVWSETLQIDGGGASLQSPTGFGGMPCVGTIIIVGLTDVAATLVALRAACEASELTNTCGATSPFSGGIIVKAVASEMEPLRTLFVHLREVVRPFLCARDAVSPRVWAT